MKLDLKSALGKITPAIGAKSIIKLVSKDGKASLMSSNGNILAEVSFPSTEELEECVIPAKKLVDISQHMSGEIELTKEDGSLKFRKGKAKLEAKLPEGITLPSFNDSEGEVVTLPAPEFVKAVKRVSWAASLDPTRGNLQGVYLECGSGGFSLTATNGLILANSGECSEIKAKAVVPPSALRAIAKLLDKEAGDFELTVKSNSVYTEVADVRIESSVFSGSYISYRDIFNSQTGGQVSCKREALSDALARAMAVGEDSFLIKVKFDKEITLSAATEKGRSIETVPCTSSIEEEVRLGFNARFLAAALKVLQCEDVSILVGESNKPIVLSDGDATRILVMPVRV